MVRNLSEMGENLRLIITRLMNNQNLIKLLKFTDKEPLSHPNLTKEEIKTDIYNNLIKIIPHIEGEEIENSIISIIAETGEIIQDNTEFMEVNFVIEVFTPFTQWIIKNENLRPFLIMGEIANSLKDKTINGVGKIEGGDFSLKFLTEQLSCYQMYFKITTYE